MYIIKERVNGTTIILCCVGDEQDAINRVENYKLSGRDVYYVKE